MLTVHNKVYPAQTIPSPQQTLTFKQNPRPTPTKLKDSITSAPKEAPNHIYPYSYHRFVDLHATDVNLVVVPHKKSYAYARYSYASRFPRMYSLIVLVKRQQQICNRVDIAFCESCQHMLTFLFP